ncbi:hypothetical protein RI103_06215 [Paraburkholderia sp. FT54]|uniref:hypothetical protein n=1 Tax=Paraburkholderia sp. FT54 TaxID=3074437 RepID=UPI002877BF0A|nr:hypothetical protein [Paraburkholderia sp. FT54]WNC90942.1 hypothetical protein RI103_06215 [Paraburkholderia sp. FT54]
MGAADDKKRRAEQTYLTSLTPAAQAAIGRQLAAVTDAVVQGAMNWGFEVVKHLAILNGAGLAAIVAIAQAANGDLRIHTLALHGAHQFVAGLMIASIAMLSVYISGLFFSRDFTQRTLDVLLGTKPLSRLQPPILYKSMIGLNWILTLMSLGLFFAGSLTIVKIT